MKKSIPRCRLAVLALIASCIILHCIYPASGWWPMFRNDPQRTGRSSALGPLIPVLKWSYGAGGGISSAPVLSSSGAVYVGAGDNRFYSIDSGGALLWSYAASGPVSSSAAISAGTVRVGADDNCLYSIDSGGAMLWSYVTGGDISSSPAVSGTGTVYVGSEDNRLYSMDSAGILLWSYAAAEPLFSSPALGVSAGTVYMGSDDNRLYCVIDGGGLLWWSYATAGDISSAPAVSGAEMVYVGSEDNRLYGLDSAGALIWSYAVSGPISSSAAISVDAVYVGSNDNCLYSVTDLSGVLSWSYMTGGDISSAPAVSGIDIAYVGSEDNVLYSIDSSGALQWSYMTEGPLLSSVAVGTDSVYIGSRDNVLYVIAGATSTPTPTPTPPTETSTPTMTPTPLEVVINEVLYNAVGADAGNEWLEFYNTSDTPRVLTGLFLRLDVTSIPYQFPEFTLQPHAYVVLHTNATGTDTATDLYPPEPLANMSNTSGSVSFCRGVPPTAGNFIDFVQYGGGDQTWENAAVEAGLWTEDDYVPAVAEGSSMGRFPDGYDTNEPEDWVEFYVPTGGSQNEYLPTPTPTATPTVTPTATPLDTDPPQIEWEITPSGADLLITGTATDARSSIASVSYTIAEFHEGTGDECSYWTTVSTYTAEADDGTFDSSTEAFHATAGAAQFQCQVGRSFDAIHLIKAEDSAGNVAEAAVSGYDIGWYSLCANVCNGSGQPTEIPPVVISEFMPNPDGAEPENEWVELYNLSEQAVDLSGWKFGDTDDPDAVGAYAGIFTFPAGTEAVSILPWSYLVLGASETAAGGNVHVVYNTPDTTIGRIYLSNTEDCIILKDSGGHIADEVCYDSTWKIKEGVSFSRKAFAQYSNFVEIYNKSDDTVNLEGLTVTKGENGSVLVPYATESALLSPWSYAVICGSLFPHDLLPGLLESALVVTVDNTEISGGIGFADNLQFLDHDGQTVVDTYTSANIAPTATPVMGQSAEKVDYEYGDVYGNWELNLNQSSTPGGANSVGD